MSICANAIQQSNGTYTLALDPTVTNPSTCAYVVETGSESVLGSLGAMSISDAETISMGIACYWALMWGFRQIANLALNIGDSKDE